jgi:hypothetical protein
MKATAALGFRGAESSEVALPADVLSHLRRCLRAELDPLQATHVLHDAGFAAGPRFQDAFEAEVGRNPSDLGEGEYWRLLGRFLVRRGWGRIEPERVHPGLAVLRAWDWAESEPHGGETQPGCHFSSGFLAYLLGRAAEAPIAVLEVSCRSRGDDHCGFMYGSEAGIHEAYGLLLDGVPFEDALAQL